MSIKLCCIADIHIGVKSYSKVDPKTHFTFRELETLKNFDNVVSYAANKENNVDALVIAGDIYHSALSTPTLQNEVNKIINKASQSHLKTLILDGNHDLKKVDTAVSALKPVDTFQINNVIHTKDFKDVEIDFEDDDEKTTCRFIFLPTYTNNDRVKEFLDKNLPEGNDYPNPVVVIGHFTTSGAKLNDWLVAENEDYIDNKLFNHRGISAVILGHLHKPQILKKDDPLIFYTGSLQRIDFNEETQEKGYWNLEIAKTRPGSKKKARVNAEFVPMDMQKFYTVKGKIEDNDISSAKQVIAMIDKEKAKDAIIRIIVDVAEHLRMSDDEEKEVNEYLEKAGARLVLAIKQKILDEKRVRNVNLDETITIDKSLEIFYDGKPRAEERITLGKKIISEYRALTTANAS